MKVLIAEDDVISRRLLTATLERIGHTVTPTENGEQALDVLTGPDAPRMAILDWMMPVMDGVEVCRRMRAREDLDYAYLILLTAKGQRDDLVTGLESGADEYLTKPFDPHELRSRLEVGARILNLQTDLRAKVSELEDALSHVQQLQGLLPICMHCKKIRDDDATWHRLETYIQEHSQAMFTHSLCHVCLETHYPDFKEKVLIKKE